jgi:hypothetical protein
MGRCRLIYTSTSSEEIISNEDVRDLVRQSAINNRRGEITGLLLLSGNRFLQVLEGGSETVNRLYGRIYQDPRHHDVELLSFEPIGTAYFTEWNMRLVDLYDLPLPSRQFLMEKYDHSDGEIQIPERIHEVISLLLDAKALC